VSTATERLEVGNPEAIAAEVWFRSIVANNARTIW